MHQHVLKTRFDALMKCCQIIIISEIMMESTATINATTNDSKICFDSLVFLPARFDNTTFKPRQMIKKDIKISRKYHMYVSTPVDKVMIHHIINQQMNIS